MMISQGAIFQSDWPTRHHFQIAMGFIENWKREFVILIALLHAPTAKNSLWIIVKSHNSCRINHALNKKFSLQNQQRSKGQRKLQHNKLISKYASLLHNIPKLLVRPFSLTVLRQSLDRLDYQSNKWRFFGDTLPKFKIPAKDVPIRVGLFLLSLRT